MTTEFRLPDLAEGVAEGEVVAWHVAEGDRVEEDDVLAEVETDKALVEVPSPYAGVVVERCAAAGEVVPVGEVLVRFESDDAVAGEPAEKDEAETGDDGETTGDAESDRTEAGDAGDGRTRPVPAPPSVRRLAREVGVDLAAVDGSGPGGRVTRTDVERAARDHQERAARGERRRREPGGTDDRAARDHQERAAGGERRRREPGSTDDRAARDQRERAAGGERDEDGERVPAGEGSDTAEPTATERSDPDTGGPRDRTLATPATRRVADELGVDLDRVPASEEREGEAYVTEADVRAYAERGAEHVARAEGPGHETEGGDD
ncbi:MAG: biotin/lipoyl-containing protein, partial [Haloferacaceae archaeon]